MNEGAVIGTTIDRLMRLRYPLDRLRVYVIDDASTDETPHVAIAKHKLYPRNVFTSAGVAGGLKARPTPSTTACMCCGATSGPRRC